LTFFIYAKTDMGLTL